MQDETEMQDEMQQEQADPAAEQKEGNISQQAKAQIKVPPELKSAYERIVLAGMKVMFDKNTHEMAMQALQGDGPIEQRLAKGISDLMTILWKQSNGSMPPQLIVPAAIELMLEAADFINESGSEQINEQQLGEAMRLTVGATLQRFGVNEQNRGAIEAEARKQEGQKPAGLIGGAMGGQ